MEATLTRPASGIREFLRVQAEFLSKNLPPSPIGGYTSLAEFILRHAVQFTESRECERGEMKQCYYNSFWAALNSRDLIYCEGYATTSKIPLPIMHAWTVDRNGVVLDPTWKDGQEYFGVPFKRTYLTRAIYKQKRYGLIDVPECRWPVLRLPEEKWKERLILNILKRIWPWSRIKQLEETLVKQCRDIDDLVTGRCTLLEIAQRNGVITVDAATETAVFFAAQFDLLMRDKGAENYLEITLKPKESTRHRHIILTLQYSDGKSPGDLKQAAEKERDSYKERLLDCCCALGMRDPGKFPDLWECRERVQKTLGLCKPSS